MYGNWSIFIHIYNILHSSIYIDIYFFFQKGCGAMLDHHRSARWLGIKLFHHVYPWWMSPLLINCCHYSKKLQIFKNNTDARNREKIHSYIQTLPHVYLYSERLPLNPHSLIFDIRTYKRSHSSIYIAKDCRWTHRRSYLKNYTSIMLMKDICICIILNKNLSITDTVRETYICISHTYIYIYQ